MNKRKEPIYVSPPSAVSLWQEYRIYADRLELECKVLLKTIVIPSAQMLDIQIRPPLVFADIFRGKDICYSLPLKIDFADGFRHVAVHRKSGLIKHIRLTPADPDAFVRVAKSIMEKRQIGV